MLSERGSSLTEANGDREFDRVLVSNTASLETAWDEPEPTRLRPLDCRTDYGLLGGEHQADDGREQRDAFDEGREHERVALDRVGSFRLTGDALTG